MDPGAVINRKYKIGSHAMQVEAVVAVATTPMMAEWSSSRICQTSTMRSQMQEAKSWQSASTMAVAQRRMTMTT